MRHFTGSRIVDLARKGEIRISEHGYDELAEERLFVRDIVSDVSNGRVAEDYPEFPKGPCVLVLQRDRDGNPIHVVWGIPKGQVSPAVVVTAYRPDPKRWTSDSMRRKK
ncbi:MAG: DUF4258 domain-containing protein [Verrucomicrobia bacterium]|nr:DUF4258 domain-containing protein [Verrucomicrobiota bacterium]MCG2681893.1 DUF4258 domain-containing protein [Kiritimatiellia bacterium]MBU4246733.1 DUF4258 domain-containing protein [Verrucomicrobiota bacterium]MBU4291154.1 DUF4258 domain-containing protein [Verrucomicrobiota bacterium]MBU4429262.1 DUF4258 domain-containing protein [Verrucomicrobiota bacterium]